MAVDFFLKLSNDIKGESVVTGHTDEVQILSFSWGASQTSSVAGTGGSGAGKANLADLNIMKTYDGASVALYKSLLLGTHITSGVMTAHKAGGKGPFMKITMSEMFVSSIQVSGSSEVPMESVSFTYNQIQTEYFKQDESGNLTAMGDVTYNLKTSKQS